jgi:hypothetical protein
MLNRSLALWLSFTGLFAALGSYSYFYMEARLKELSGYQPRFLKYPTDLWEVYVRYRGLTLGRKAPQWPLKAFAISLAAFILSVLYLLLAPKPFG